MKHPALRWTVLAAAIVVILLAVSLVKASPKNPVAMILVVDGAGNPTSDAVVQPEKLLTKAGPYVSGWYGWMTGSNRVISRPSGFIEVQSDCQSKSPEGWSPI